MPYSDDISKLIAYSDELAAMAGRQKHNTLKA